MTTPSARSAFVVAYRVNSAGVVQSLLAAKVKYVELDVRLQRGRVVLSHFQKVGWVDGWLERDNARLRFGYGPPYDPTIDSVLRVLPPSTVIVFDSKDRERARMAEMVATTVDAENHVVSSRHSEDLEIFGRVGFRTWQTIDTAAQVRAFARQPFRADGATVRHRALSHAGVRILHDSTDVVVAWTVNSRRRAGELVDFGVDGMTTDSPTVIRMLTASG